MGKKPSRCPQPFPIVEVFGFEYSASSREARLHFKKRRCPFAGNVCEKFRQYRFGYCSVVYAAKDDGGIRHTYAVCDHRLDGAPVQKAVADHFGAANVELVPEVVLTDPRTSFDYVAISRSGDKITDAVVIETQAIDIRGGGVGPVWQA
jgi:hypothetical protein